MIDSSRRRVKLGVGRMAWAACGALAAACGSQVIYDQAAGGAGGAAQASSSSSGAVCGNGIVEAPEQCDDGPKNGMEGCGCNAVCTLDLCSPCGNGKVDVGEECDLGMANSCVDGTTSNCTCVCKNEKCGDGIVQAGECCDDANGGGNAQMSKCTADCKGCKNPNDPGCKCVNGGAVSVTAGSGSDCLQLKTFKGVVSSLANPAMQGGGMPLPLSYKGFVGALAAKALCQAIGADHVCSYDEVLKADGKSELKTLPANLSYWLYRTTLVPDYAKNNGMKTCTIDADCPLGDSCDPASKVCSWQPGKLGRCSEWSDPNDNAADGEWFATLPDKSGGGVPKGSLSFHFFKDAAGVPPPVCQDEKIVGCAGPCSATRAILCCFPCLQ